MGDLSKNLSRHEMACACGCGFDTVDGKLGEALQNCVDYLADKTRLDIRLDVRGGNRCREHNDFLRELFEESGGKSGAKTAVESQHIYGRAADVKLFVRSTGEQVTPRMVAAFFENCGENLSVGRYSNRTHVDTRTDGGKRWRVG